jgi:hypothetical protein
LWRTFATAQKRKLIHDHAATVFEDLCQARFSGAQRYWERHIELDLVAPDPNDATRLFVAEVKWRRLSAGEKNSIIRQLESKWTRCRLRVRYPRVHFEVLDAGILAGRALSK